jgi:hypothetical protein
MKTPKKRDAGNKASPDKNLVATCGIFCGSCGIYLATREQDSEKILRYALVLNQSMNETYCMGCRAQIKSAHCSKMCSFIQCTAEKGIEHCGLCLHFPCEALTRFQSEMPHRACIVESLTRLKQTGYEHWLREMQDQYQCTQCQTVNSAYHLVCRNCGTTPSCTFTSRYLQRIKAHLEKE